MYTKTRALTLRSFRYGEGRMIADLFTEAYGRLSFITASRASPRRRGSLAALQPLTPVEIVADIRPSRRLHRWREIRLDKPYVSIPADMKKTAIALFLDEFLVAALRGENQGGALFEYILDSMRFLDAAERGTENFHIVFLTRMSRFLGFYPNLSHPAPFFDLRGGVFTDAAPPHPDFLNGEEARLIPRLTRMDYATMPLFRFTRRERARALDIILTYYRLHLPAFPPLRSLEVLRSLFG